MIPTEFSCQHCKGTGKQTLPRSLSEVCELLSSRSMTAPELAEEFGIQVPAVMDRLYRLEREGLVKRDRGYATRSATWSLVKRRRKAVSDV